MARVNKQGIEYFPLNVNLDNKFKFLQAKHGLEGFAIAIKLLQLIYSEGYWIKFGDDEMFMFASDNKIGIENFKEILETCLEKSIFSSALFDKYHILTSRGIQKQYKEVVKRRKDVVIVDDYLLIDYIVSTSCKHDASKSTQREREREKETERETEIEIETEKEDKTAAELSNLWTQCGYGTLNSNMVEKLMADVETFSLPWVIEAIEIGNMRGKRIYSYIKGILNRWQTDGKETKSEPGRENLSNTEKPRRKYGRQRTEEELDAIDVNDPSII